MPVMTNLPKRYLAGIGLSTELRQGHSGSTVCQSPFHLPPTVQEGEIQRCLDDGRPSVQTAGIKQSIGRGTVPVRCRGTVR